MKVYYKLTQKYNLSYHRRKAFDPIKKAALVTANSSESGTETSLLGSMSSSAYATTTEFALEGSSELTSYNLNESGMDIAVNPVVTKTNLFEDMKTAFSIMSSQDYPFVYFTGKAMNRVRALMNINPSPPNLVAETVLNNVSSEDPEVRYLVDDDYKKLVKVRQTAFDNDFENGLYERIFKDQQDRRQTQQQQKLFAPGTE
jgi:hypothetical protein